MNSNNLQIYAIQQCLPGIAPPSCDLLLQTVSCELDYVLDLLGMALEVHILDAADDEEVRAENIYWDGWNQATQVLEKVRDAQRIRGQCAQCRGNAMSCIASEP